MDGQLEAVTAKWQWTIHKSLVPGAIYSADLINDDKMSPFGKVQVDPNSPSMTLPTLIYFILQERGTGPPALVQENGARL